MKTKVLTLTIEMPDDIDPAVVLEGLSVFTNGQHTTQKVIACSVQPYYPTVDIREWLATGNESEDFPPSGHCYQELMEGLGNILDSACSQDILGEMLFRDSEGGLHMISTEVVLCPVDAVYLRARE